MKSTNRKSLKTLVAEARFDLHKQDDNAVLGHEAWGRKFVPHYFKNESTEFHRYVGERCDLARVRRGVKEVIRAPRGSGKSVHISFLHPLRCICEGSESYIILISDSSEQAEKYLDDIKEELTHNSALAEAYPNACGEGRTWNIKKIVTQNNIMMEAKGLKSKIRGSRKGENRPSLFVIDDPEGDEAGFSELIRQRSWDVATRAITKAGSPETNFLVGGTMIHRDCLVGRLSEMPGWTSCLYKSIIEYPINMDLWEQFEMLLADINNPKKEQEAKEFYYKNKAAMDEGSEVLWEDREPLIDLMIMRASEGHAAFEAEKQNNPIDPSKCEWPPTHFEGDDIFFSEWPVNHQFRGVALDPSKGAQAKDKIGDYSAIVYGMVSDDNYIYIDCIMERMDTGKIVRVFTDLLKTFRPHISGIEANSFQDLLIDDVVRDLGVAHHPPIPIENTTNKRVRILSGLDAYFRHRRIRFKRRSVGIRMMIKQLLGFPDPGEHDDGPDALEMLMKLFNMLAEGIEHDEVMKDEPKMMTLGFPDEE